MMQINILRNSMKCAFLAHCLLQAVALHKQYNLLQLCAIPLITTRCLTSIAQFSYDIILMSSIFHGA